MPRYRLMSTRHNPDGSLGTPSAVDLSAADDRDADDQARRYPLEDFCEVADFAWLVDERGIVVSSFPVAINRAA